MYLLPQQPSMLLVGGARTRIAYQQYCSMPIHHPIGITVEIVGIQANSNGRSCDQHDVCGSALDDDVVVRLRKVQILNSEGREESAIAAYLVSDGIDQCRVGFLQRHLVRHAKSFDGVLAQVTEVYSVTSESPTKRKKCLHNMGCCLAAVISAMPPLASSSVDKITRRDEEMSEEEHHHAMIVVGENNTAGCNNAASTSSENGEDYSPAATPPPASTPQRTRAQTKKAGGLTTPPLALNDEPHCTQASTKHGNRMNDKPKRKVDYIASPVSGLLTSSATKKVKRVESKDKK